MTVEQIQCLLTYLGYNPGAVDGVNGLKTAAAVLVFQQQEGLRQDGVPGPETQEALLSAVATGRMYTPVTENQVSDGHAPDWWGDIRYFKRDEFRCPCGRCGGFPVEPQESMVRTVDEIRRRLGVPVSVVDGGGSGVRCAAHNAEVGGVANSQHLFGLAADLHSAASPAEMKAAAEEVLGHTGGIGLYGWGIHVDTRPGYARWNG